MPEALLVYNVAVGRGIGEADEPAGYHMHDDIILLYMKVWILG